MGLTTNHRPTLPSHKSLMGINLRYDHENVNLNLNVIYPIEAHYTSRQLFSVFFFGITYCVWVFGN